MNVNPAFAEPLEGLSSPSRQKHSGVHRHPRLLCTEVFTLDRGRHKHAHQVFSLYREKSTNLAAFMEPNRQGSLHGTGSGVE